MTRCFTFMKLGTYLGTLQCADDLPETYFRYYATNTDSINVNQVTGNVTLRKQFDFEVCANTSCCSEVHCTTATYSSLF